MPPKGRAPKSTLPSPPRLQSVPHLRIQRPNASLVGSGQDSSAASCLTELSSVLSCWASSNYSAGGCMELEKVLMRCADKPKPAKPAKNSINYHLGRLYPKIKGPTKREGSLGRK